MYLLFKNNDYLFGIPVKDVFRVIDRQSLVFKNGRSFANNIEIKEIDFSKISNLKGSNLVDKKKLIIIDSKDLIKPALLVNDVVGFIKEDLKILKKQDFLNKYGYEGVRGFLLKNNVVITLMDVDFFKFKDITNGKC